MIHNMNEAIEVTESFLETADIKEECKEAISALVNYLKPFAKEENCVKLKHIICSLQKDISDNSELAEKYVSHIYVTNDGKTLMTAYTEQDDERH